MQHSYEPSRQSYQYIPAMRPAEDGLSYSATPIYDALYSEYRRSFRALPGDRSGEEDLRFRAFGALPPAHHADGGQGAVGHTTSHTTGTHGYGQGWQAQQYGGYAAARPHGGPAQVALPPAPRRGM
ncbi:hypothetical protein [Streptomyces roseolilacinus]|uniref:hypothetical protein n=1 Tax=Streptomyces roseolilacinus TaxID=66904 RepID=UPI00381B1927